MTAPHPIVARYELGEPERQGPLGLVKRRQLEDIPKTKPHEVLVWRVGNRYVVDRQERRAHDDILVRASSVSVVSVRPGTEVQVEFRIDTQDAAEFVVRVTFSCSVVDPVTVVRNGQVNVADALLEYLHAYPDLSQLGLKYSVADVNKIRTAMAAHIRAYMAHYPPRIPGIEIGTATVHVETPVALGKIQKINEEQLTPSHTWHKSPESPVRRNGARRVRREAARKRPGSCSMNPGPRRAAHPTHRPRRTRRPLQVPGSRPRQQSHGRVRRGARRQRHADHRDAGPLARGKLFRGAVCGNARRECLDHLLIYGEQHLRQVLSAYARHYNEHRPHQSRGQRPPLHEPGQAVDVTARIKRTHVVQGLISEYRRAA